MLQIWMLSFSIVDDTSFMQCPNLSYLNVSNNILEVLPQNYIRECSGLTSLDVSYNQLVSFPNAWDCNMVSSNAVKLFTMYS